ncbi:plasmid replication protein RepC, partial [Roseobacter sp.]|uniref:plasmid replication protein RepC n=1 Tax=Roseobacter sp. TaxID=1907202 RepID=UPI0025F0E8BD
MTYQPVTPFRRAVDAAVIEQITPAGAPLPETPVNKWDVLRNLGPVRQSFGLSDRALVVLQALLSFHPETDLGAGDGGMIVFPSNASICARLNGMPCSTMRRHLADLVRAGLILRRDSPNGKRFARRGQGELLAFGFDLTPLVRRADEIAERAEEARAAEEQLRRLRLSVSVMRRDLAGLGEWLREQQGDDQMTRNALRLAGETA